MGHTVLLYGATGFSGRLIAAEAERVGMTSSRNVPGYQMVLAGRDGREVAKLADAHKMDHRVFGIDNRWDVVRGLADIDVVINAAGPFALTADHLAKGALAAGCHYVDINGEAEVYMKIDDLGRHAIHRERAMVASAGHTAAASDLLLQVALQELRASIGNLRAGIPIELGAVRIALSRFTTLSRGSMETLWRSLREQVRIVRLCETVDAAGLPRKEHVIWHEPVGTIERTFDFMDAQDSSRAAKRNAPKPDRRIASAANLVDTLTARLTLERNEFSAGRIESYVEVGSLSRLAYQFGPLLTPLAAMPWARDLARLQLNALPAGPTPQERGNEPNLVVLQIEDRFQQPVVHWVWRTPNPYDFTAQIVLEVAKRVAKSKSYGWLTASEILQPTKADLRGETAAYLRGCRLNERRSHALEIA